MCALSLSLTLSLFGSLALSFTDSLARPESSVRLFESAALRVGANIITTRAPRPTRISASAQHNISFFTRRRKQFASAAAFAFVCALKFAAAARNVALRCSALRRRRRARPAPADSRNGAERAPNANGRNMCARVAPDTLARAASRTHTHTHKQTRTAQRRAAQRPSVARDCRNTRPLRCAPQSLGERRRLASTCSRGGANCAPPTRRSYKS